MDAYSIDCETDDGPVRVDVPMRSFQGGELPISLLATSMALNRLNLPEQAIIPISSPSINLSASTSGYPTSPTPSRGLLSPRKTALPLLYDLISSTTVLPDEGERASRADGSTILAKP